MPRSEFTQYRQNLILECEWQTCSEVHQDMNLFIKHVQSHLIDLFSDDEPSLDDLVCDWKGCGHNLNDNFIALVRHVYFHAYHTKVKCYGKNYIELNNLSPCLIEPSGRNLIPDLPDRLSCSWENCKNVCDNPCEYYAHVTNHSELCDSSGISKCCWNGCDKTFKFRSKLRDHLRSHSQEKVIACPTCGSLFSSNTKFLDHLSRQKEVTDSDFKCSHCYKIYSSERLLRDHMRLHVNHYKCPMCEMTCCTPSTLRMHYRQRHREERPYVCTRCDLSFKTRACLKQHADSHNTSWYECHIPECQYTCKSFVSLNHHFRTKHQHSKPPVYRCHVCNASYPNGFALTKHLKKMHNFKWPAGHKRFKYREELEGVYFLQTVRYESIELTQQILLDKIIDPSSSKRGKNEEAQISSTEEAQISSTASGEAAMPSEDVTSTNNSDMPLISEDGMFESAAPQTSSIMIPIMSSSDGNDSAIIQDVVIDNNQIIQISRVTSSDGEQAGGLTLENQDNVPGNAIMVLDDMAPENQGNLPETTPRVVIPETSSTTSADAVLDSAALQYNMLQQETQNLTGYQMALTEPFDSHQSNESDSTDEALQQCNKDERSKSEPTPTKQVDKAIQMRKSSRNIARKSLEENLSVKESNRPKRKLSRKSLDQTKFENNSVESCQVLTTSVRKGPKRQATRKQVDAPMKLRLRTKTKPPDSGNLEKDTWRTKQAIKAELSEDTAEIPGLEPNDDQGEKLRNIHNSYLVDQGKIVNKGKSNRACEGVKSMNVHELTQKDMTNLELLGDVAAQLPNKCPSAESKKQDLLNLKDLNMDGDSAEFLLLKKIHQGSKMRGNHKKRKATKSKANAKRIKTKRSFLNANLSKMKPVDGKTQPESGDSLKQGSDDSVIKNNSQNGSDISRKLVKQVGKSQNNMDVPESKKEIRSFASHLGLQPVKIEKEKENAAMFIEKEALNETQ